ncbi:hypothetical protein O0L34_g15828 [Tuta absoluta]|nr:hypothetical protein O0L34_g15828 [Tuta absoluta]
MGSVDAEDDGKLELNDSGCVQDESLAQEYQAKEPFNPEAMENGYTGQARLLDLSDDVLLCILKYCSPHDLKALGFTCARLGALVLERSLWVTVDARDVNTSRNRMRWLLGALHEGTRDLLLTGYAEQAKGCRGHVNRTRKEVEEEQIKQSERRDEFLCGRRGIDFDGRYYAAQSTIREVDAPVEIENINGPAGPVEPPFPLIRQHARLHINAQQLPRQSSSPSWPEECEWEDPDAEQIQEVSCGDTGGCPGPVFTLTALMIKEIRAKCPKLASLSLERCNINCNKISPSIFPPSLKRLSLRGTRCYNPPLDKSYLFRIHDYLPALEFLDLSECPWLEPAALLPLSKLVNLRVLLMQECPAMAEFVAYVSLATRYGFRALQVLDLRGSPVGDSEVSALGWLPELQELYLEAPKAPDAPPSPLAHHHYIGDPLPKYAHMDNWELEIPEYYKSRSWSESESAESSMEDIEAQVEMVRETYDHPTHPFSIELHTRVIQAAPRALAQMNDSSENNLRADPLGLASRPLMREVAQGGMVISDDMTQRNIALRVPPMNGRNEALHRAGINEAEIVQRGEANRYEAATARAAGVRRNAEQSDAEPGPSKRSKTNDDKNTSYKIDEAENGECSKDTEKDDAEKAACKFKIFKNKYVSKPGPSNNDKGNDNKSPDKAVNKKNREDVENITNSLVNRNLNTDKEIDETVDKMVKAVHGVQTVLDETGLTGTVRYEYNLADEGDSQDDKPNEAPSQPKKSSNYEDEYKTYKYNLRVNDGAGPSKESGAKSNEENSSKDKKESQKEKSTQNDPKFKIDVNEEAGTSGYSIRNRSSLDGEPSAKKTRRTSNDKQGKGRKNTVNKTEERNVEMQEAESDQLENERLKPDSSDEEKDKTANNKQDTTKKRPRTRKTTESSEREKDVNEEGPRDQEMRENEREDEEPQERERDVRVEPNQPPQYVRFRRNQEPVIIQCPVYRNEQRPDQPGQPPAADNPAPAEARHHVLYVNLGQQLHAVYRLLPNRPFPPARARAPLADHLDNSALVSGRRWRTTWTTARLSQVSYTHGSQQLHAVHRLLPNRPFPPARARAPLADHLDNSALVSGRRWRTTWTTARLSQVSYTHGSQQLHAVHRLLPNRPFPPARARAPLADHLDNSALVSGRRWRTTWTTARLSQVSYTHGSQQLHAVYRLLPNRPFPPARARAPLADHLDNSALVSGPSPRRGLGRRWRTTWTTARLSQVSYTHGSQQLHAVYRLLPNRPFPPARARAPLADHLDNSALVSDASIRRFGRADGEDVNIVHIGPHGPQIGGRDTSGRPNRSNLRILSARGYRHITDRRPRAADRRPRHLRPAQPVQPEDTLRPGLPAHHRQVGGVGDIVHIGAHGPQIGGRDTSGRPNRSNLRILSARGYRHITDRSLVHLATAAPHLHTLDFSGTNVTAEGVERFKTLRPDVSISSSTFRMEVPLEEQQ